MNIEINVAIDALNAEPTRAFRRPKHEEEWPRVMACMFDVESDLYHYFAQLCQLQGVHDRAKDIWRTQPGSFPDACVKALREVGFHGPLKED